jgi:hypothetical protein
MSAETVTSIATIAAIVLAPVIAIGVGVYLNNRKEKREAKLWIFRTLMATRASRMSQEHIRALNMIDVTFYGKKKKSKAVVEGWKILLDHFAQDTKKMEEAELKQWTKRGEELFIDLLQRMADYLKYDFGQTDIKNTSYFPVGHGEVEDDLLYIRKGFVDILQGKLSMPIEVRFAQPNEEGKTFQENLKKYFSGETPIQVIIKKEE